MKAALSQIAFARSSDLQGAAALLETALAALDRNGSHLPAAYVDHALQLIRAETSDAFEGIAHHREML